jgi:perosamine synthetase
MSGSNQSDPFAREVVESIMAVTGSASTALHEPEFDGNEWNYVKECIDTNFVSSVGKYVDKFERDLEEYTGSKHAIAVTNGTSALHISLLLAGVEPGDEVLIPALTFVATANAVVYCGGNPHFVDSEEDSLGIDHVKLRSYLRSTTTVNEGVCRNRKSGRVVRAIVPMHTFGHPSRIEELLDVCSEFSITMVEDAAESLGSFYKQKHTGTFGLLGTLSFNGNKIITTGGGGAILTSDSELARKAKHLTTTAKDSHKWRYSHDQIGYNYRLPNLNAALGCAQLENIEKKIQRKRRLYELYEKAFTPISGIKVFQENLDCRSNYWLQTLLLDPQKSNMRDQILHLADELGLQLRPAWDLISGLLPYKHFQRMELDSSEDLSKRIINIPSSPGIVKYADY